jgi:hypothetical protein
MILHISYNGKSRLLRIYVHLVHMQHIEFPNRQLHVDFFQIKFLLFSLVIRGLTAVPVNVFQICISFIN